MKIKEFVLGIIGLALIFFVSGQVFAGETYFSKTELQLHSDWDRDTGMGENQDILTLTMEHFSEWKYGDNYFFLDIEGGESSDTKGESMYFEFAPRFSLNKIFNLGVPEGFLGETYLTAQYNDGRSFLGSDIDFIHRTWLYGISFDFNFQPNYGFSNLSFLYRNEATQDSSYQITFVWGQPFKLGNLDMAFNGFIDFWEDDAKTVFLSEPQIRLNLSSFFGQGNFLSDSSIGMEFEISRNFFGPDTDWIINPTVFFSVAF